MLYANDYNNGLHLINGYIACGDFGDFFGETPSANQRRIVSCLDIARSVAECKRFDAKQMDQPVEGTHHGKALEMLLQCCELITRTLSEINSQNVVGLVSGAHGLGWTHFV